MLLGTFGTTKVYKIFSFFLNIYRIRLIQQILTAFYAAGYLLAADLDDVDAGLVSAFPLKKRNYRAIYDDPPLAFTIILSLSILPEIRRLDPIKPSQKLSDTHT